MFSRLTVHCLIALQLSAATLARAAPGDPLQLPTYGISVLPPHGMVQMIETAPEEMAVWSRIDKVSGRVIEVVRIEVLHSEGHTLAQVAAESAKQAGGEVARKAFRIDGMPAMGCEFKTPHPTDGSDLATTAMILIDRKELIYRASVQSALIGGNQRASDLQILMEGWKFQPIVAPGSRLELRHDTTPVFDEFALRLPVILRPYPTDDPTVEVSFGVEDYRRQVTDFLMTSTRIPKEKGEPFAAFWARKAQEFQKQHGGEEVVFRQRGGQPARAASDTIRLIRGGAVATTVYGRWILVDTPGETAVLMTCKITSPYDLKSYEEAIDTMVDTIALAIRPASRPATKPAR